MFRQTSSLVDRKQFGSRGLVSAENPPSPPDTESLSSHPGLYATPHRRPSHPDNYMLPTIPGTPETHESARVRRLAGPSSHSFSRDFRGASRPQTRWLVVLLPPENLITELSVGYKSAGKLSSGLLIPLFPTLFAQLSAIAKEFSLPSTTGLCLYLSLPDSPESPRITDDVWPLLWARHLHTDDSSLPLGLPVAGRVQFDIDIPSARWYPMWFAHVSRKELVPDLARAMQTSPKPMHSPLGDPTRPRGAPRPLALVPRQEPAVEVQIDSGPSPVPSPGPKSASNETVEKVRRWSALVTPDPAALQPEAPAIPANESAPLPTDSTAVEDAEPEPLNLEDFQWSVTSAGPPSPASSCATTASSRVPSIHLLERAAGSVLLTPSTATTWGPHYDSDIESEFELDTEWRVRSPDMGERAEGSVLLTPSTATSWGAPLSYPPTPAQWTAMHELVRSPDLGERAEGSVLLTPSTATTWGAPLSYPPTPAEWHALYDHIARSPDLGRRAEGSVLRTPSTATSWGAPLSYPPTPAGAQPREWVPSPGLGDREDLSPGRFGRMSTVQWGAEVETEEEAYARMGLPYRWEFGWPTASPLPDLHEEVEEDEAGSVHSGVVGDRAFAARPASVHDSLSIQSDVPEGVEEDEDDSVQAELVQGHVFGTRSVSASVHDSVSVRSRTIHEQQYEAGVPHSESEDGQSLYDGAFGEDEEREEAPGSAFEFELELESPQVGLITEERSLAVEHGHGQELADAYVQEAEVSFNQEMDNSYREPFEYAPEDVSEASDNHASEASIEGGVFEYSFPESAAEPSFPVSVSASDDAIGFPDLDHIVPPESPMIASRVVEAPVHVQVTSVIANVTATAASASVSQVRNYGAYPYLVIYPSAYPHLDLYPNAPASRLQTRGLRPTVDVNTLPAPVPAPSPAESVSAPTELSPGPAESTPSPVESLASQTIRSPPSSRKSSLSITVPPTGPRSRSMVAVNPANKRSAEWSRTLPPVPPVPRAIRDSSAGSISSLRSVREESAKSVREERVPEESADVHLRSEQPQGRRPSVVYDDTEFELSTPSRKLPLQPSSIAYPYRYPDNLVQLYPSKEVLAYPTNLERIYPAVRPVPTTQVQARPFATVSATTKATKAASEKLLAVSSNGSYPAFDLYPAVYPYNLERIYPAVTLHAIGPFIAASSSAPVPSDLADAPVPGRSPSAPITAPKAQNVVMLRGYPFIDLYPAVYPHNLERIYPSIPRAVVAPKAVSASTLPRNLKQTIAVAPASRNVVIQSRLPTNATTVTSTPGYPFNLDNLYPVVASSPKLAPASSRAPEATALTIVPSPKSRELITEVSNVRLVRTYPNIELYAPVYPFNLDIYPSVRTTNEVKASNVGASGVQNEVAASSSEPALSLVKIAKLEVDALSAKTRKSHAQLHAETLRKTHAQLVAEVLQQATPASVPIRVRKSHTELETVVFPDGLPEPEPTPVSPQVMITAAQGDEQESEIEPTSEPVAILAPEPATAPAPAPASAVAHLRRQRSGTIMRPPPSGPLPVPPPVPQGADLGRSRSMLEARAQMFERTPSRSQTDGPQGPRRTIARQKSASFERAKSLFHTPEENQTQSEGSRTPPRPTRRVSKLDMSKFGFA